MKKAKVIKECPVCHSEDIIQEIGGGGSFFYGIGSHCGNCGIRFAYNSIYLLRDLNKAVKPDKDKEK